MRGGGGCGGAKREEKSREIILVIPSVSVALTGLVVYVPENSV